MSEVVDLVDRLGISADLVVREFGHDDDVDDDLRAAVEERVGSALLDEDSDEVADVVLLWFREDDGDLLDALVDASGSSLDGQGVIWLLTPTAGRQGAVEPSDVSEAVATAGLASTSSVRVGAAWTGLRVVRPSAAKVKR